MSVSQSPEPQVPKSNLADQENRHGADVFSTIEASSEFEELKRKFRGFVFPMTAFFLTWYFLYIVASIWGRGLMDNKIWGNINVAYILGLSQFISTFVIAYMYWRFSNAKLDPLASRIRGEIEELDGSVKK